MVVVFVSLGFLTAAQAHAYAVVSVATDTGTPSGSYDIGGSLQNLISPFTGFFNNLKFNSNTTIAPSNQAQTAPVTDLTPTVTNDAQNILSQWLGEFDNWFYGVSGVRLSGIFYVLLNAIAWTLGLAQQVVNWLLGLFR